jgi:hypothetical protein
VSNVKATLIADGALINGENGASINWLTETGQKKLDDNKLTINGRLFTYNTRGGSITPIAGLPPMRAEYKPKCFENGIFSNNCDLQKAGNQDLERFRLTTTTPAA